ncbi:uncharacterized protein LOC128985337 [Macrosteles quadrilineatus]|uniref:uncharacterized protein LOC128985337 n=1 Tax=Macrosteles quadrilineatus TaxID=74068 RepID=UPI0023E1F970|nr:uncharacterized protein LOC128985337 [Macrosteles quadrilineatus]XP_054260737.1 uncharacterized protein LOC128985337 [Macrosteles quadrilineatus]
MEETDSTSKEAEHFTDKGQAITKQINRLKKEDDEEQWISGEELNTDGSSDEEGKKGVRRRKREHKGARPKEKQSSKDLESIPKPPLVVPPQLDSDGEEPIDISWKPKRGSIKLPHMTKDLSLNTSSTSASAEPIAE